MAQIIVCLECITNLHAGSGDVNYNIIDNEVERDPVTQYATINSSGVKGALREYFRSIDANSDDLIKDIFGSDKPGNTTQGKLKFLAAEMLAIAARASKGDSPYYLVSTDYAIKRFCKIQKEFLRKEEKPEEKTINSIEIEIEIEGYHPKKKILMPYGDIYILEEEDFRKLPMPVIARNCLDNGISVNLWYEEVVPHDSRFYFPVLCNDNDQEILNTFSKMIDGKIVQFGGNASIGYGLCKISVMEEVK